MSRVPDDRSLVFLSAGALSAPGAAPGARLREFIATRGNRVAWFDASLLTETQAEADAARGAEVAARCGWHAPESAGYSWEALARRVAPGAAGAPGAPALLTESLFLRWLDAAGIGATLVFLVAAGLPDATYVRGSRRITFMPAERFAEATPGRE